MLALVIFFAAFTTAHDLAHQKGDWKLALAGLCMLTSGHGLRVAHMRHHARPLTPGDYEGIAATVPLWQALVLAPWWALRVRVEAWRLAGRRNRRWQLAEYLACVALAVVVPREMVVVMAALQVTAPFWAGRLPHLTPAWMMAIARWLMWTRLATVQNLVLHDAHHARPALPMAELARRQAPLRQRVPALGR